MLGLSAARALPKQRRPRVSFLKKVMAGRVESLAQRSKGGKREAWEKSDPCFYWLLFDPEKKFIGARVLEVY